MTSQQPIVNDHINNRIRECVELGYSIRRISLEVSLSYSAVRNRLKNLSLSTLTSPNRVFRNGNTESICIMCGRKLSGLQTKYCSTLCKSRSHSDNSYESQVKRARERKLQLIEQMGGKCSVCGYNANYSALCFHHLESKNKKFTLDSRNLSNHSMKNISSEANKCILLCCNCHAEIHNPSTLSV